MATLTATSLRPITGNRGAGRFGWVVVAFNVLNILWGALVRATGSGAGCGNHWPLCNGQVIPVSPGVHTSIEFTHRMLVAVDSPLIFALLVWTFLVTVKGQAARTFSVLSTILLLNEALLGALLVKLGYVTDNQSTGRMVLLSIHLSNTLLLLASLAMTARFAMTSQRWAGLHRVKHFAWALAGLVATLVVGVSGSMAALGDTLFPATSLQEAFARDFSSSAPLLLRLRMVHPISAVVAAWFVVWLISRSRGAGSAGLLTGLLAAQFGLGIADVLLLAPAWLQILHLLGADLYWIALVVIAADVIWPAVKNGHPTAEASGR